MHIPKISIIVPVYNVQAYIHKCIESILAQDFTDFELLLIDDGSIDYSGEICDNYSHQDSRIRVFHKENGGVSSARNLGLDNAIGEWISFIDPDDWIDKSMLSSVISHQQEANVILYGYKLIEGNEQDFRTLHCLNYGLQSQEGKMLFISSLIGKKNDESKTNLTSIWCACFKRVLISNIRFKEICIAEDFLFLIELLFSSNQIYLLEDCFYNYRKIPFTACRSYNEKIPLEFIRLFEELQCLLIRNKAYILFQQEYENCILSYYGSIISKIAVYHKSPLSFSKKNIRIFLEKCSVSVLLRRTNISFYKKSVFFNISVKYPRLAVLWIFFNSRFG